MIRSQIESFGRVRPPLSYNKHAPGNPEHRAYLELIPPPNVTDFMGQGTTLFPFHAIFDKDATQEDVFNRVGAPMVNSCLEGHNGTIFCYGQTGSGKTYTMAGDVTFEGRGIIPRSLEMIFNLARQRRKTEAITMKISCMEIYNEVIYDLLPTSLPNASGPGSVPLDCWPRVTVAEDASTGGVRLKGLSEHEAPTLERALALLFQGSLNRVVATTPMNDASSRGHCIFTVHLTCRPKVAPENGGVAVVRTSKFHLVDLAGSERVRKSGAEGATLSEAKHINLSLHFLEQVIVALHEKNHAEQRAPIGRNRSSSASLKRSGSVGPTMNGRLGVSSSSTNVRNVPHVHVPYRNSTLTSVLRDSFGGNCKTVVLTNMSADSEHWDETVSTARFAQRCSLLHNEVTTNEHCAIVSSNGELIGADQSSHHILLREYKKIDEERHSLLAQNEGLRRALESLRPLAARAVDDALKAQGISLSTPLPSGASSPTPTACPPVACLDVSLTANPTTESTPSPNDVSPPTRGPVGSPSTNNNSGAPRSKTSEPRVWRLAEVLEHVERRGLASRPGNSVNRVQAEDIEFSCVGDLALLIREIIAENNDLRKTLQENPPPTPTTTHTTNNNNIFNNQQRTLSVVPSSSSTPPAFRGVECITTTTATTSSHNNNHPLIHTSLKETSFAHPQSHNQMQQTHTHSPAPAPSSSQFTIKPSTVLHHPSELSSVSRVAAPQTLPTHPSIKTMLVAANNPTGVICTPTTSVVGPSKQFAGSKEDYQSSFIANAGSQAGAVVYPRR